MGAAPVTVAAMLLSESKPDDAVARLRHVPFGMPARIEQPGPSTLLVQSGSRLMYRLLGAWLGGRRLPMRPRFDAEPCPRGSLVRLTMTSDAGWYPVNTSLATGAYEARFAELLTIIEAEGFTRTA